MRTLLFSLITCATALPLAAQQPSPDARLREQLKQTMVQLRTAETERATLQAAQAELEAKNKALTAQIEAASKQANADKEAADKALAEQKAKLETKEAEAAQLSQSLEKWKAAHKQINDKAVDIEGKRRKLELDVVSLKRVVADQKLKNSTMYKLGNELLDRYEKFGLGEALTRREPFIGTTRVKFQTLVQDYQDGLNDAQIKP